MRNYFLRLFVLLCTFCSFSMAQDSQESSIRRALQTEVSSISESLWQASKDAVVSTLDEITTELFSEEALASRESRDDSAESNDDNKSE